MRQPGDVAWGLSSDHDRQVHATTKMSASPLRASPQKDMMSSSRLPSPTKFLANASNIEDRRSQNDPGPPPNSTNQVVVAPKSQMNRSSSLRQPSSRFALGQRTTSQGHGKSNSLSHGTSQAPGLRTVAEPAKTEPYSSTHETLLLGTRNHMQDTSSEISGANNRRRIPSTARNAGKTALEYPQSVSSSSKPLKTKPEFSTYQQHFTPKKALQVSLQNTADVAADVDTISAEVLQLRDELLQLSLLYTSAQTTKQRWQKSAKDRIEKQIGQIAQKSSEHTFEQQMGQTQRNLEALELWLSEGGCSPTEKVKILSRSVQEVTNLTSEDGKAGRVIGCFCDWFDRAIVSIDMKDGQAIAPIAPLEVKWRDDARTAIQAMEMCGKQLQTVHASGSNTAVKRVSEYHIKIVSQTIEELTLMLEIGDLVLEQANKYARRVIDEALDATDNGVLQKETLPQGIWNTM